MTVKGGTSQACAACKYQRRKCSSDCPLAPYFPPDQPKQFQNAHKLFGVSNILKILKNLDPNQKVEAMRSIVFQANIRDKFPVHGCYGIVHNLHNQVQQAEQELEIVNTQLAMFRQHHYQMKMEQQQHHISSSPSPPSSQLQLGTATPAPPMNNNTGLSLFHQQQQHQSFNATTSTGMLHHEFPGHVHNSNNHPASSSSNGDNNSIGGLWVQQAHGHIYSNGVGIQSQHFLGSQSLGCHSQASGGPEVYDEISPFFDTIDDQQSYIDSKEAYDSSSDSSFKDTIQSAEHVGENELKSAAACFTLTSVN
ncbi:LOB domain-containing protein 27-like [Aristolochia californica]|uniref:LOB domain-containing protein 27-like n=1 Tax=Aristolochia californica TaxID=171875 RepID=UPI0035D52BF4